jgi:hypothetical protein
MFTCCWSFLFLRWKCSDGQSATRCRLCKEMNRIRLYMIWGFRGCGCEECCLLGYIKAVCTSQETHYVPATESSQLMLCKIWGFHGTDYEEYRLLGYINAVLTSQETHYVSTTESSQLTLCKIWGFHGGDYEECHLLGCYVVWLLYEPTFRRNLTPPSSGWRNRWTRKFSRSYQLTYSTKNYLLRNVGSYNNHTLILSIFFFGFVP